MLQTIIGDEPNVDHVMYIFNMMMQRGETTCFKKQRTFDRICGYAVCTGESKLFFPDDKLKITNNMTKVT